MSVEDEQKKIESPAPRRTFLKQGFISIAGLATAGAIPTEAVAAQESVDSLTKPSQPFKSQRVIKSDTTGAPPRQQHYLESETIGSNDVKLISKIYTKRTDFADSYDLITIVVNEHYQTAADTEAERTLTFTSSLTGVKGPIEGDYRMDTVTTTSISPQGVSADEPRLVRVLLKDPTPGMSDQERLEWILNRKKGAS